MEHKQFVNFREDALFFTTSTQANVHQQQPQVQHQQQPLHNQASSPPPLARPASRQQLTAFSTAATPSSSSSTTSHSTSTSSTVNLPMSLHPTITNTYPQPQQEFSPPLPQHHQQQHQYRGQQFVCLQEFHLAQFNHTSGGHNNSPASSVQMSHKFFGLQLNYDDCVAPSPLNIPPDVALLPSPSPTNRDFISTAQTATTTTNQRKESWMSSAKSSPQQKRKKKQQTIHAPHYKKKRDRPGNPSHRSNHENDDDDDDDDDGDDKSDWEEASASIQQTSICHDTTHTSATTQTRRPAKGRDHHQQQQQQSMPTQQFVHVTNFDHTKVLTHPKTAHSCSSSNATTSRKNSPCDHKENGQLHRPLRNSSDSTVKAKHNAYKAPANRSCSSSNFPYHTTTTTTTTAATTTTTAATPAPIPPASATATSPMSSGNTTTTASSHQSRVGGVGPQQHMCLVCRKGFKDDHGLRCHTRTHTGERPFVCPTPGCRKAFTESGALGRHKSTHSDKRPHVCEVCGKTYKLAQHLKRHHKSKEHLNNTTGQQSSSQPLTNSGCNDNDDDNDDEGDDMKNHDAAGSTDSDTQ